MHGTGRRAADAMRIARNQATFRAANEPIAEMASTFDPGEARLPFICECSNPRRTEIARLTLQEYGAVRSAPRQFLVVPGHEGPEERVVARTKHWVLVTKVGAVGDAAARLDDPSAPEWELDGG
jgi:hypothetical protein